MWHNTNVSFNVFTNQNLRHSTLCADPEELLKDSEKCHLHQLSSGVKFIQTRWSRQRITFSRHTMRTKGSDSRGSDKDLADPEFVHLQRAGGGPEDHSSSCIDIVCPFRAPPPSWFPLLLRRMALQQPVGFLDYRSLGFLHLKVSDVAQRLPIHPLSNAVERWKTVQLCTSVRQKKIWGLWSGQEVIIEATNSGPICWIKAMVQQTGRSQRKV